MVYGVISKEVVSFNVIILKERAPQLSKITNIISVINKKRVLTRRYIYLVSFSV